ncbi:hypothetical protein PJ985_08525 [Streptomyces sp. ACA25]|uniref:hypothetical protein n=1 Tax=Streptomyces sp. ACA25 TaxID=3022596 RepID=UPI0023077037|nr:hypothetical protein [Streptomyces sp. ACA25]MDB1087610.1 hypothetical protein [Streptomyces sp. ACA25]
MHVLGKNLTTALAALIATAPVIVLAPAASAADTQKEKAEELILQASLDPVPTNRVTGSGTAHVKLNGRYAEVTIKARGLVDAPHAMHFHIAAKGQCPPESAAKERNGNVFMNVLDGAPFYGGIGTSLTTSGDTSPDSGLAIDRFPSGSQINYHRTVELSKEAEKSLRAGTGVVVVHGIDYNGNGVYDDVLGASELDPSLPAEATNPALCGALKAAPLGSVAGGLGGTQTDGVAAAGIGTGLLAMLAGAFYLRRRSSVQQ